MLQKTWVLFLTATVLTMEPTTGFAQSANPAAGAAALIITQQNRQRSDTAALRKDIRELREDLGLSEREKDAFVPPPPDLWFATKLWLTVGFLVLSSLGMLLLRGVMDERSSEKKKASHKLKAASLRPGETLLLQLKNGTSITWYRCPACQQVKSVHLKKLIPKFKCYNCGADIISEADRVRLP